MATTTEETAVVIVEPEAPASERERDPKSKKQPPYAVILHNDDVNGFNFVTRTLQKVFHYTEEHAFVLTLMVHRAGRGCVWFGMKEHAELKADQLRSCGPDPMMVANGAQALRVSIEPLPS